MGTGAFLRASDCKGSARHSCTDRWCQAQLYRHTACRSARLRSAPPDTPPSTPLPLQLPHQHPSAQRSAASRHCQPQPAQRQRSPVHPVLPCCPVRFAFRCCTGPSTAQPASASPCAGGLGRWSTAPPAQRVFGPGAVSRSDRRTEFAPITYSSAVAHAAHCSHLYRWFVRACEEPVHRDSALRRRFWLCGL
jgi:hypothetical protein